MTIKNSVYPLLAALTLSSVLALAGCEDFFTKSVMFGGNVPGLSSSSSSSSSSGSSSGSSEAPADDDADGLSNEVESTFSTATRVSDTDFDGFDDGLEFVGRLGDPLNARLSPTSFGRERNLSPSEVIVDDRDSDRDGLGDKAEGARGLDANNPDSDEDGYQDGLELVGGSNALSSSSRPQRGSPPSADGVQRNGTPPADRDGDGIADDLESLNGGNADRRDTDQDGFSDGIEFLMGSAASDPASVPEFATAATE